MLVLLSIAITAINVSLLNLQVTFAGMARYSSQVLAISDVSFSEETCEEIPLKLPAGLWSHFIFLACIYC